ncbi:hypothetical protein MMC30_002446 [Trapelia coarctata]|nr:hypothetical protein [Trapelia coarctata]
MALDPTIEIVIIVAAVLTAICLALLSTLLCKGGYTFPWDVLTQNTHGHQKQRQQPNPRAQFIHHSQWHPPGHGWAGAGGAGGAGGVADADMTGLGGGPPAAADMEAGAGAGGGRGGSNMTGLGGFGGAWGGLGRGRGGRTGRGGGSAQRSGSAMSATIQPGMHGGSGVGRGGGWAWPGRGRGGSGVRGGSRYSMSAVSERESEAGNLPPARGGHRSAGRSRRERRGDDGFEMVGLGPPAPSHSRMSSGGF